MKTALLIAASALTAFAAHAEDAAISAWDIEEVTNPMSGETDYTATLKSDAEHADVTLILRCRSGKGAGYFAFNAFMGFSTDVHSIRMKFDNGEPRLQPLSISADNRALGVWSTRRSAKFAELLARHDTLVIEFKPERKAAQVATFSLTGSADALRPIADKCKS